MVPSEITSDPLFVPQFSNKKNQMSDYEEDDFKYGYENDTHDYAKWDGLPNTSSPTMPGPIPPISLMQQNNGENPNEDGIQWEERSDHSSSIKGKKKTIKTGNDSSSSSSFTNVTISSMAHTPKKDCHLKKDSKTFLALDGFYNILVIIILVIGIFLVIGGLMTIIDISKYDSSSVSSASSMGKWALVMGIVLTLLGTKGLMILKRDKKIKIYALIFFIILFIFTILDIILCIQMVKAAKDAQSDPSSYWDGMTDGEKSWVQDNYQCCGYNSFVDGAIDPCPINCLNGCYESIDSMVDQLYTSSIVCIWISVIGIILIGITTILYVLYAPNNEYRELSDDEMRDDQSFISSDKSVSTLNEVDSKKSNAYSGKLSMII